MSGKRRLSKDQARKARLAKRARKSENAAPKPYSGSKYHKERWAPYVYETELGIYEGIVSSERTLTNRQVKEALCRLIEDLRSGVPPRLPDDELDEPVTFVKGEEVEFLVTNIRWHWTGMFQRLRPVPTSDLIGILRTLLYSIEAHAWHTGPAKGYVAFLDKFMEENVDASDYYDDSLEDEDLLCDPDVIQHILAPHKP